jgi:glycosyltransferase involved in cell wall biosynthesis
MNIGIVTTWFERGAAYVSRQYLNALKNNHHVFIYARGGEHHTIENSSWDNKNVTWGKKTDLEVPMAIDLRDFKKWILRNNLDLVFFNEQQWWRPVLLCEELGIKTGAYVDYYTENTIPLFNIYDFLICNTKRHYNVFKWHSHCYYIPWGTDTNLFYPKNYNPVKNGIVTFFHSCGMSPDRKGTDILIKAFSQLQRRSRLIVQTQVDLSEVFPRLNKIIENLRKSKYLEIYHKTVPAPGLYHLGDVYVYPSRLDGIGLTIIEALASGLPVITSDNPPMNEFIDDTNGLKIKISYLYSRSDGYYWPQCETDISDLVNKMEYYIKQIDKIPVFKRKARCYAEENLNWGNNSKKLSSIFKNVTKNATVDKMVAKEMVAKYEKKRETFRLKLYDKSPYLLDLVMKVSSIINKFLR